MVLVRQDRYLSKHVCCGSGRIACSKGLHYWPIDSMVLVNWSIPSSLAVVSGETPYSAVEILWGRMGIMSEFPTGTSKR